ncbi:arginine N-succinyltransferase [Hydrocarboniclastica marina]|uniref:arginine N-succinyltransferase n=1 Tax=Hydrocarboniclastica marina TaxID=2259620 RepID=UPI001FE7CB9D|nr:arginine N-succinyltransferase [Hydrocarboniclastica marina]
MSAGLSTIRPIRMSDLEDLYEMARSAGVGVTTLPADRELLRSRIERSVESFDRQIEPELASYLFALEETDAGRIVGVCGIDSRVGLDEVWYNYRLSNTVNSSRELGVHVQNPTLYLTNDMTNSSELCTLFLDEAWRGDGRGPLLSRSRFLFLADFAELFSEKIFAELRGVSDQEGRSPFWEALGRRFFNMDFYQADMLTGRGNKAFIAELMPKHPIYLALLGAEAQDVVGKVHENTRPALRMLEAEGFNFNGLLDIFDAGPVIEAFTHTIRAIRDSRERRVVLMSESGNEAAPPEHRVMVSNRRFEDFRVLAVAATRLTFDTLSLAAHEADALGVAPGDSVRLVGLKQATGPSDELSAGANHG